VSELLQNPELTNKQKRHQHFFNGQSKIVISYHGRQGGFFGPFSNAREKKRRSRFFPEHLKRGAKNYPT
jgi:hypothetical protein